MADILTTVDKDKQQKWNDKYEQYQTEEWNRDNFERKLRNIENDIKNIEDFITGLQEDIRDLTGVNREQSEYERIEDRFGSDRLKRLESKNLGSGMSPTLKPFDETSRELAELWKRLSEWKTLQFELADLARKKMKNVAVAYKNDYKSGEVAEDYEKHAQQLVEKEVKAARKDLKQQFASDVAELEQAVNSARNETKNAWKYLEKFADVFTEYLQKKNAGELTEAEKEFKRITEEAVEEGLEKLATERGTVDLSGETQAAEEKKSERESARSAATSGLDVAKYNLAGKSIEEQHEELQLMSEEESLLEMTPDEVSSMTDVSEQELVGENGVLDSVEEEYGTRFGID